MPGQARKFTDEERNALVRAVLVDGMTQVGAKRAAEAGELIEGHPFTIARGTLQGYLRRAAGDPNDGIRPEQIRAQLLSALKREIDAELPKLSGMPKLGFIRQALGAVAAIERHNRAARPSKEEAEEEELVSESLDRLEAAHKARTAPASEEAQESEGGDHGAEG